MEQELNEVGSAAKATRSPCGECQEDNRPECIELCRKRLDFADWDHGRGIMAGFEKDGTVRPIQEKEKKMVTMPMKNYRAYPCCGEPLGSPHAETCNPGVKNPCNICGKEQQLDKLGRKTGYCRECKRARMVALNDKQAAKRKAEQNKGLIKCPKCGEKGLPSVYGNYCTKCANEIRECYPDAQAVERVDAAMKAQVYPDLLPCGCVKTPPYSLSTKLSDLKGIAPDITGGLSSEEYVRMDRMTVGDAVEISVAQEIIRIFEKFISELKESLKGKL